MCLKRQHAFCVTLQPVRVNAKENDRFNISQLHEILLIRLQISLDEFGFPIRNWKTNIKASMIVITCINVYIGTDGKRWQCLVCKKSKFSHFLYTYHIGTKKLGSVEIQKETTRVQVLGLHIEMTANVPFVLVRN